MAKNNIKTVINSASATSSEYLATLNLGVVNDISLVSNIVARN